MSIRRWVSAIAVVLMATGPLVPLTVGAQTSTSATAPLAPLQSMQPETVDIRYTAPAGPGARIGAGVLNVVYVPGKALICGTGTVVAGAFMLATFGTAYREAVSLFNEGCGGAWLLTGEQVAAAPKKLQLQP